MINNYIHYIVTRDGRLYSYNSKATNECKIKGTKTKGTKGDKTKTKGTKGPGRLRLGLLLMVFLSPFFD